MKIYNLIATKETVDIKTGVVSYDVSVRDNLGQTMDRMATEGMILLGPLASERDMIIVNPVYTGGDLVVKMKPFRMPAKKYAVDEVVAQLVTS